MRKNSPSKKGSLAPKKDKDFEEYREELREYKRESEMIRYKYLRESFEKEYPSSHRKGN